MRGELDIDAGKLCFERVFKPRRIGKMRAFRPGNRGRSGADHADIQAVLGLDLARDTRARSMSLSTKDCGTSHSSGGGPRARAPPNTAAAIAPTSTVAATMATATSCLASREVGVGCFDARCGTSSFDILVPRYQARCRNHDQDADKANERLDQRAAGPFADDELPGKGQEIRRDRKFPANAGRRQSPAAETAISALANRAARTAP